MQRFSGAMPPPFVTCISGRISPNIQVYEKLLGLIRVKGLGLKYVLNAQAYGLGVIGFGNPKNAIGIRWVQD